MSYSIPGSSPRWWRGPRPPRISAVSVAAYGMGAGINRCSTPPATCCSAAAGCKTATRARPTTAATDSPRRCSGSRPRRPFIGAGCSTMWPSVARCSARTSSPTWRTWIWTGGRAGGAGAPGMNREAGASHRRGGSGLHATPAIERHVVANRVSVWVRNAPDDWLRDGHLASAGSLFALRIARAAVRHPSAVAGAADAMRRLPKSRRERRAIMGRRKVEAADMSRWAAPTPWRLLLEPRGRGRR